MIAVAKRFATPLISEEHLGNVQTVFPSCMRLSEASRFCFKTKRAFLNTAVQTRPCDGLVCAFRAWEGAGQRAVPQADDRVAAADVR